VGRTAGAGRARSEQRRGGPGRAPASTGTTVVADPGWVLSARFCASRSVSTDVHLLAGGLDAEDQPPQGAEHEQVRAGRRQAGDGLEVVGLVDHPAGVGGDGDVHRGERQVVTELQLLAGSGLPHRPVAHRVPHRERVRREDLDAQHAGRAGRQRVAGARDQGVDLERVGVLGREQRRAGGEGHLVQRVPDLLARVARPDGDDLPGVVRDGGGAALPPAEHGGHPVVGAVLGDQDQLAADLDQAGRPGDLPTEVDGQLRGVGGHVGHQPAHQRHVGAVAVQRADHLVDELAEARHPQHAWWPRCP
jgi:hypothetical protein